MFLSPCCVDFSSECIRCVFFLSLFVLRESMTEHRLFASLSRPKKHSARQHHRVLLCLDHMEAPWLTRGLRRRRRRLDRFPPVGVTRWRIARAQLGCWIRAVRKLWVTTSDFPGEFGVDQVVGRS